MAVQYFSPQDSTAFLAYYVKKETDNKTLLQMLNDLSENKMARLISTERTENLLLKRLKNIPLKGPNAYKIYQIVNNLFPRTNSHYYIHFGNAFIRLHRGLVFWHGPFFQALLSKGWKEHKLKRINLKEVDSSIVPILKVYFQTGEVKNINKKNVIPLLQCAEMYFLEPIVDACLTFLIGQYNFLSLVKLNPFEYRLVFQETNTLKGFIEEIRRDIALWKSGTRFGFVKEILLDSRVLEWEHVNEIQLLLEYFGEATISLHIRKNPLFALQKLVKWPEHLLLLIRKIDLELTDFASSVNLPVPRLLSALSPKLKNINNLTIVAPRFPLAEIQTTFLSNCKNLRPLHPQLILRG